ncbi:DUF3943 domain-containing protein [Fibrobacter sp. UWEL]|uniref:DUF3943 domain-containing protein n=1 Tax=Fibrobacter sp. UWEL TaxID=1896209 RepID=UPI00091ABA1C|nr:DUF3943 domain-containing protein [Fibrobacter sp. UWEL]SHL15703.1 protein of unknown function [Fibrobacter sp. UWEL]
MKRENIFIFVVLAFCVMSWSQLTHQEIAKIRNVSMERDSVISIQEAMQRRRDIIAADSIRVADSLRQAGVIMDEVDHQHMLPEDSIAQKVVSPFVTASEVLGLNVFVWSWDYYVLDKHYAHTGPDYWKRNIREGWKWDHNHWAINFYGHPYQGSMYYASARAGGNGFYRSMVWTALGSFTWEMFAETEYPAPNDLLTTTIGGSMYGEVLYRLSRLAYNKSDVPWYRQLAAFVLEPAGYLQRKAFGNRDFYTGWVPVELVIAAGAGSRFGSDYRIGGQNADELDEEWRDRHGMMALHLEYGKPYTKVKQPFDYFTVDVFGEGGLEGNVLQLDIMGKLKNIGVHGRGHWIDFSINLDYDSFYGELATVSTIALGGALDLALWVTPKLRFRVENELYWILLGTADMGYDDLIKEVHPEYSSDMNNYQYNLGLKYSLMVEFLYKDKWRLYNMATLDAMRTIPSSLPHYGAVGWDFLLLNHTALEYKLTDRIDVGNRLDTYLKMAAYSSEIFEPMSRRIFTFSLYFNFHLMTGK